MIGAVHLLLGVLWLGGASADNTPRNRSNGTIHRALFRKFTPGQSSVLSVDGSKATKGDISLTEKINVSLDLLGGDPTMLKLFVDQAVPDSTLPDDVLDGSTSHFNDTRITVGQLVLSLEQDTQGQALPKLMHAGRVLQTIMPQTLLQQMLCESSMEAFIQDAKMTLGKENLASTDVSLTADIGKLKGLTHDLAYASETFNDWVSANKLGSAASELRINALISERLCLDQYIASSVIRTADKFVLDVGRTPRLVDKLAKHTKAHNLVAALSWCKIRQEKYRQSIIDNMPW